MHWTRNIETNDTGQGVRGLSRYVRNMSTRAIISAFLMTLTPGTLRMFLWDHSLVVAHWVFIQIIPEEQSSLYYSCRLQNKAILLTFLNIISSVGAQFKRTETPDWRLSLVYPLYSRCYEMQTFGLVSSCSIGSVNLNHLKIKSGIFNNCFRGSDL